MNAAALASMLVLGRLEDSPTGVCGAWLEAAERRCGRPAAADTWLCPRHVSVARRRLEKAAQKRAAEADRARARTARSAPGRRAELEQIERRLLAIDPLFRGNSDPAVVNLPLASRLPSDARISELAQLHARAQLLRSLLGRAS